MNCDEEDRLELQHLAGGNIVEHAPVFSAMGRFIFVRCGLKVQVFVSSTGELTREMDDAKDPLICLEIDQKQPDLLLGCTSAGQFFRWHWRTGVLQKSVAFQLGEQMTILTCNLLNMYKGGETACAFVTAKGKKCPKISWFVVNTSTGEKIHVDCGLSLKIRTPVVDVGKGDFKFIILAQGQYVYFLNYETWDFWRFKNMEHAPITCVRISATEELAATGDKLGRIILWRRFHDQVNVSSCICHWHHTEVTSIAFSPGGASFYSSGLESVLVKWSIEQPEERKFVPRMSNAIRHIVISDGNEHVLVCTEDNAMQFVGALDHELSTAVQHFTYDVPNKTGQNLFPMGLCLNPRTNTLVLNGRNGHLQFYSAYTKNLLYNLHVVEGNRHNETKNKIMYNTRVTRAAFNINWMATGEVYNDQENFAEVRLKFWKFNEKLQSYALNTNIELPHELGIQTIIFSNQYQVDNLRCATAGKDNVIKLWALAESGNIYRPGSIMWNCVAQTSYRNLAIGSIAFAQDGSLLAAGYGNTLVLYDSRTLHQLHALSCPPGYDGVLAKAQLSLAKTPALNGQRKELTQQRQQLWTILKTLLDSDDKKLIEQAKELIAASPQLSSGKELRMPEDRLKESVYKFIMKMPKLSLHQKLQLLRRFGIECTVPESWRQRFVEYLQRSVAAPLVNPQQLSRLDARLLRLQQRHRFKAKHRLDQLARRRQNYEKVIQQDLLSMFSVLQLDAQSKPKTKETVQQASNKRKLAKKLPPTAVPMQGLAQISHVQFGAGSQAHLVAVCTESRVLIWNLMRLRLQAGLKLSVRQLAFDPLTNLIAVITKNDELHVFQPNVPLPVYQRCNLPKTYGLVWLPRRQPKQSSINVDWQAQSTLLMLTHTQEIVYLSQSGQSPSDDAPAHISFGSTPAETKNLLTHATFGSYVAKQQRQQNGDSDQAHKSGPLIKGRGVHSAVNGFINLSAHTMPAMSLICNEFIKSLLTPAESECRSNPAAGAETTLSNGNGLHHEDSEAEEEELEQSLAVRKTLLEQNANLKEQQAQLSAESSQLALDAKLKRIAALDVHLEF